MCTIARNDHLWSISGLEVRALSLRKIPKNNTSPGNMWPNQNGGTHSTVIVALDSLNSIISIVVKSKSLSKNTIFQISATNKYSLWVKLKRKYHLITAKWDLLTAVQNSEVMPWVCTVFVTGRGLPCFLKNFIFRTGFHQILACIWWRESFVINFRLLSMTYMDLFSSKLTQENEKIIHEKYRYLISAI